MEKNNPITVSNQVVLFTDIHEFSICTRTMDEATLADFFQEIYERLGDIIVTFNGEIIKYIGDAILCVFPTGSEKDAVQCARGMRHAYLEIVEKWGITHDTELEVGIHAGDVAAGIFGHASLRQKDVFGEAINVAAMIGHHRGIAVTEAVHRKIEADFPSAKLPDFKVKWRDSPLEVWEIKETS
ncbi:MAG: adenylate/guanylate cyclase domain-containing protein [Proteobacteria bacterium]|nr:adenylate/guanylate cyclase domain-containing protein [Pseudomonadota bacterium]